MSKRVDVVVDLQFGSTGKGLLSAYLSTRERYTGAISVNMPNAGHTAYDFEGNKFVHKVLPSGLFSPYLEFIGIGPGSVFSIDRLAKEWANVKDKIQGEFQLMIHEAAGVLTEGHAEIERASLGRIASTMQGSGAALCDKVMRNPGAIARDNEFAILAKVPDAKILTSQQWTSLIHHSTGPILVEGSQGYSLGLSAGFYPHCTSRDCTPARVLADANVPLQMVRHVHGSCRVHPIRVGNVPEGTSGGWYKDQQEICFGTLGVAPETTTVTGRVRRVATFSKIQIQEAILAAMPDHIFLNFFQYNKEHSNAALADIVSVYLANQLPLPRVYIGEGPMLYNVKQRNAP